MRWLHDPEEENAPINIKMQTGVELIHEALISDMDAQLQHPSPERIAQTLCRRGRRKHQKKSALIWNTAEMGAVGEWGTLRSGRGCPHRLQAYKDVEQSGVQARYMQGTRCRVSTQTSSGVSSFTRDDAPRWQRDLNGAKKQ